MSLIAEVCVPRAHGQHPGRTGIFVAKTHGKTYNSQRGNLPHCLNSMSVKDSTLYDHHYARDIKVTQVID